MARTSFKKQATGFKQMSHRYKIFGDEMSVAWKGIGKIAAEELKEKIIEKYDVYVATKVPDNDPQTRDGITVYVTLEDNRYRVGVAGDQAIYDEFGTGENGLLSQHPEKAKYPYLDAYNSGETIQIDQYGFHYWIYNGVKTYGVPSGHFIYDATMEMADYKLRQITERELKKTTDKCLKGK